MSAHCWNRFQQVARQRGADTALICGDDRIAFEELRAASLRRAATLEIAPGDRVLVSGANSIAMVATILAVWRRGGIPVFVHPEAPARHLAHAIDVAAPALAIVDDAALAAAVAGPPSRDMALTDAGADSKLAPIVQSPDAPASILFTSGSTGLPKGVTQSAANLISGADRVAALLGYGGQDRILCAIPFAFDYGWGQLLSTLFEGITLMLPAQQNAFGICQAIADHAPTVLAGVPSLYADLLSGLSPIAEVDKRSIRLLTNTGSKLAPPLFAAIRQTFPDAALSLNYGLTETYRSASLPCELADIVPESVGFAIPGVDVAILKADGTRAGPDEEGEILHRGAGVFLGYWGEPERTAQVLRPDPFWPHEAIAAPRVVYTGDLGRMDGEGRLYVHGRRDGQMKSMGVRVSRDEIELILHSTGLINEAAVVAKPHDTLGDMIVACVVPKCDSDAGLRELKKQVRERTNRFMQPRAYHVLERLPRNPNGKVDYPALRALVNDIR